MERNYRRRPLSLVASPSLLPLPPLPASFHFACAPFPSPFPIYHFHFIFRSFKPSGTVVDFSSLPDKGFGLLPPVVSGLVSVQDLILKHTCRGT